MAMTECVSKTKFEDVWDLETDHFGCSFFLFLRHCWSLVQPTGPFLRCTLHCSWATTVNRGRGYQVSQVSCMCMP